MNSRELLESWRRSSFCGKSFPKQNSLFLPRGGAVNTGEEVPDHVVDVVDSEAGVYSYR